MFDVILEDLKGRYGAKVLLDPADLEPALGMSEGQQANRRSKGNFPVPYTKDGGRVKVSIYALANYLSKCSEASASMSMKEEIADLDVKPSRKIKKAKKGHLQSDWWRTFSTRVFNLIDMNLLQQDLVVKMDFVEKKRFKP